VRVLFDQGTPAPLRHALVGHSVETAFELGWGTLQNGTLIVVAKAEGFDVFPATDKNLKYQQNLAGRRLAVIVLSTTSWPRIRRGHCEGARSRGLGALRQLHRSERGVMANRSVETDTQRHCAATRAREHTSRGSLPVRAGQLQRQTS